MSIQSEIDRISTAVQNAHLKVIEKGGTSTAPYLVANLASAIDTIPEATEPTLQSKSVTPSESAQTVKPDTGYDGLSQVSVGAISKTYVGSSVPKQAAQTITPGTADKTIASGRYLTGTQTIKGDANLLAGNIKSGVSIFGVAGTVEEGEDVTAETNTYTSLLDDLEAAIDELPDAGSGKIETCTVTLMGEDSTGRPLSYIWTTIDSDGNITCAAIFNNTSQSVTITDVVCGSMLLYNPAGSMYNRNYQTSNAEILADAMNAGFSLVSAFKITAAAGEIATITAKYSYSGGIN